MRRLLIILPPDTSSVFYIINSSAGFCINQVGRAAYRVRSSIVDMQPSSKLQLYIDRVQQQTGRTVTIQESTDHGLSGMRASTTEHPTDILVRISPNNTPEQFEQSVAHEVTHGLIKYKHGYQRPKVKDQTSSVDAMRVNLLLNAIEDVVVNKLMRDEGFQPYAFNYLDMVKQETKDAEKRRDTYAQDFPDPLISDAFKAYRYILAWGFIQYCNLPDKAVLNILKRFIDRFKVAYSSQYVMAKQVTESIVQNDIFTAQGFDRALRKALEAWNLSDLVEETANK